VAWNAFKDQDGSILPAEPTAADTYQDYRSMKWMGDNKGFYLLRGSRDLKRWDLCRVDVGADSTKTIVSERLNTYVETRNPKFLPNGDFVWWSERNGWANLYLYGADGTLKKNLTEGSFHVEDVLGVTPTYLVVSACGVNPEENPYQMHNYRVPLAGGPMVQLDMDDMDVLATASYDGKYMVANYSRVDYKPAVMLVNTATGKRTHLEEADFSRLFQAGYKFPERFKVKAADGITDLWGELHKPFDFDSTKVYPIADYVYPGPQVEANDISWRFNLRTDRLAQLGMIVISVGNRGGHPNRSKWYHNYGYGNLRDYGLEDQKYAIQQLGARYKWIDLERVGIHGHSGGGFMSTAAILQYNDFFKAAVSCAGNHDNSIYNRWWSEQHHGIQEKVSKGDTSFVYSIKTNQEIASRLKGHLMLVHGDIDNNVNPANTIRVVNDLIKANKRFELVILPGQRHGFGDMNDYFFWKMADWYSRWLIGDKRERPIDIPELNND
jgi:dipeptidyl aminopeptidase/acylaminoacyl peptidase